MTEEIHVEAPMSAGPGLSLRAATLALLVTQQSPQLSAQQAASGVTAIVGATVVDGTGGAPLSNATVLIEDRRIAAVVRAHRSRSRQGPT